MEEKNFLDVFTELKNDKFIFSDLYPHSSAKALNSSSFLTFNKLFSIFFLIFSLILSSITGFLYKIATLYCSKPLLLSTS